MATHFIDILDASVGLDASGNVVWEPLSANFGSNNTYGSLFLLRFVNTGSAKIKIDGCFEVPQNYSSATTNPTIVAIWSTTATTGNVRWDWSDADVAVGSSADPSSATDTGAVTSTAAGTARETVSATVATLTKASYASGDLVEWFFDRDKSSGSDTLSADAFLFKLRFVYADA